MYDSAKYLIHADIHASGVVERSDVVGAIFGQTEGLLGEDLDLRDLQESSKVGRIDVEIESEGGRSFGTVTIASGLDKVETAVLAAGLETIDRVGPCRAEFEVTDLEDAREAKRREVVERATDLLVDFEDSTLSSHELVEEVRQNVRVADITEYEGLPAGPRAVDSDAIIVVEGRADVLTLLQYGIKNAVAVEGTDVPDAVAELTRDRTVTAFLDGDRGGDLILRELTQVGRVDYAAFAPDGQSVEDLSRTEVLTALRRKVPYDQLSDGETPHEQVTASADDPPPAADGAASESETATTDDSDDQTAAVSAADGTGTRPEEGPTPAADQPTPVVTRAEERPANGEAVSAADTAEPEADTASTADEAPTTDETDDGAGDDSDDEPQTVAGHVETIIGAETGQARLLDGTMTVLAEVDAEDLFGAVENADTVPATVVVDDTLSQRVLDVAAQRGVDQIIARAEGEFVKQPTNVRVRTAAEV